jgi:hypothetical protein
VATWHPNESVVLEVIRALGLELQIIFNKNAENDKTLSHTES